MRRIRRRPGHTAWENYVKAWPAGQDTQLLQMLFFEEMTVTGAVLSYGYSRKSIRKRRVRILEQLRVEMESKGVISGCF